VSRVSIAVVPGSFDPVTLGHLDVVRRAAELFGEVVVAVAENPDKSWLIPVDERVRLLSAAVADMDRVRVARVPGLLADFCRDVGATAVVKGLRSGGDYDAELVMARMNRHLGVETVFLPAGPRFAHIASSLVKEVARHGGRIDDLVPPGVAEVVRERLEAHG
jgi:pantetheine-phosphate adenylyltransferase